MRTVPAVSRNLASLGSLGMCSERLVRRTARPKPISLAGSRKRPVNSPYSMLPSWFVSQHSSRNSISSAL